MKLDAAQRVALESLVDSNTLTAVIEALGEIAYEKAEHVASAWQDLSLAAQWHAASRRLAHVAILLGHL